MELGLDFDDSDFIEAPKEKIILTSYNAKICAPKWFLTADGIEGHADPATAYKFQGDYQYRHGDYMSAAQAFNHSLSGLGAQNRTMRREVVESLSRCHLKLGHIQMALELTNKMMQDCMTDDQMCQAVLLQQQIYRQGGQLADEVLTLYKLLHRHSFNANLWMSLAQAFRRIEEGCIDAGIYDQEQPRSTRKVGLTVRKTDDTHLCVGCDSAVDSQIMSGQVSSDVGIAEMTHGKVTAEDLEKCNTLLAGLSPRWMQLTCYVRIRLILESVEDTVGSFVKEKNACLSRQIEENIQSLVDDDRPLDAVTKFLEKDMFTDTGSQEEDQEQKVTEGETSADEFNNRWFSWIRDL